MITCLLFLFLLLPQLSYSNSQPCFSSSCGKITNITHPFRLKQDPAHCGNNRYELDCVNNVTVLSLYDGYFLVESINYNNYTIRVVDPNIQPTHCSSLPRFFLYRHNFSFQGSWQFISKESSSYQYTLDQSNYVYDELDLSSPVIFMKCTSPPSKIVDKYYADTSSCLGQHTYAIVGDPTYEILEPQCRVKLVTLTSFWGTSLTYQPDSKESVIGNISNIDIHNALRYGFEISWMKASCPCDYCFFNYTINNIQCVQLTCTFDSCGYWAVKVGQMFGYVAGIVEGFRELTGLKKLNIYKPSINPYRAGIVTGKYILPYLGLRIILGIILFSVLLIYTCRRRHESIYENIEDFLQAIKMLKIKSKTNGQDFISEVATLGRIHHSNVVRLIGFCVEGSKRGLVYEFMPNGSLDKYIFNKEEAISLTYNQVYEISLGVARGISYLHQDFGLAKLYPIDNSIGTLTAARGTIGYMAPELFYKNIGGVSYKADVYSFGMLLIEMTSRRRNLNSHVEHSSQLYFPFWIYDQLVKNRESEMEDIIMEEFNDVVKKMFLVALWCIQLKPIHRPSMNRVVEMLENVLENIEIPPKPILYPHETIHENLDTTSMETESDTSSTSYVEEITTTPLLKFSAS
ncbi:unnamed protein product [Vicia faba]|uniref:Protein kinase domain-containing protein n=1 Tax=Vicia faba TaxID=3906 RepID=A0AAV1A5W7_VICFA|nr:unnamed protein product [Vicia faba]